MNQITSTLPTKPAWDTAIADENRRRNASLTQTYDPLTGIGCTGPRVTVNASAYGEGTVRIPQAMTTDPDYAGVGSAVGWARLRCRYDFEYWAARCVTIKDKLTYSYRPFMLNAPQRRIVGLLERSRLRGEPMRLIVLKARQWGCSTVTQMYMAWLQTCVYEHANALVCAHVKDAAATIRGIYTNMLDNYPKELWLGDDDPQFKPFERTSSIRQIVGRGCTVTIASAENPNALRGADYSLAHLSEVAFWKDTDSTTPEMFVRAINGAINHRADTLIVMESTANGVSNYFHTEWVRATEHASDKQAVFVPWYEIEMYRSAVSDPEALWLQLDDYEFRLWQSGLTLEMIQWFHDKRREYQSLEDMLAEYPTTAEEAFSRCDNAAFEPTLLSHIEATCTAPIARGELRSDATQQQLSSVSFSENANGNLSIWSTPKRGHRYIVAVDTGTRFESNQWTVIVAIDRNGGRDGATAEVVAQWRGRADYDLIARRAAEIATYYDHALLAMQANAVGTRLTEGDPSRYILGEAEKLYNNLYSGPSGRWGVALGQNELAACIAVLTRRLREGCLIERCAEAVEEMRACTVTYTGALTESDTRSTDMVIARAMALYVADSTPIPLSDPTLAAYLAAV